jgi:hypothetical protein
MQLYLASMLFYAAWNPPFILLILFSTVVDFGSRAGSGPPTTPGVADACCR